MPLPSFVIIPFVTLLLGLGKLSLLIVMVFSVFWSMSYQLLGAFDTVRLTWDKQIKNLKWNFYESITRVYIPAAAPTLLSLSSMSWTYMWRVLVSLEVAYGAIGGYYGLGSYMIEVKNKLDVAIMYVILIVIAITGVIINSFIENLRTKINW
jgi:NitT/TauT family transport system permease protein